MGKVFDPSAAAQVQEVRQQAVNEMIMAASVHLYARFLGDMMWTQAQKSGDYAVRPEDCRQAAAHAKVAAPYLAEAFGLVRCQIKDAADNGNPKS